MEDESDRSPSVQGLADSSLLHRLLDGDPDAVSRVANVARYVVGGRAYVIPEADRQDLVQECLVHVYRACRRPGFRLEQSMEAFVRAVAYRRCVDWMRRRRSVVPVDPAMPDRSARPDAHLAERETIEQGRRVLQALGENCREVIRMRAIEALSYRQVAERIGKSEGAARNIMYRCLQEARAILESVERAERRGPERARG